MNPEKNINFDLSYPVDITNWDGRMITLKPEDEIIRQIEALRAVDVKWCMVAGLQIEEPLAFDIFSGARECGELIEAEGLKISSHHCLLSTFAPLDSYQDEVKIKMKKNIDFCKLLNTEVLAIHPGRIDGRHEDGASINSGFEQEVNKHGIERILDVVADNFKTMGEYASHFGIKLALENMGRFTPLGSIDILPELIERVNLPNVGYCFDSGHAHAFGESMTEWIDIAGDKLFTTHFHDNQGKLAGVELPGMFIESNKEYDEHSSPGFGTINWIDVINSLRKINYKFPVNFETGGWPDDDPREGYKQAIAWWRNCEKLSYNKIKQD
jgi:sugar phosphate isomerase/epimerase